MRKWFAWIAATAFFATAPAIAGYTEPDPAESPHWPPIQQLLFGDRAINADDREVIRVYLNLRADDASTVPVMVNGLIDQTPEEYIKRVYLVVERNPTQTAGVFDFTPDSGRVKVETRLRFEDFSFVRAVAEMNDGRLYMSQRYVRASGGCSAPNFKNLISQEMMGKMRFRIDDSIQYNKPALVQVQIRHPNESAIAVDMEAGRVPQFVRSVNVTYNGKPVMTGQVDFSLSDNPVFRFYFVPREKGELRVEVEDTHDKVYVQSLSIAEGLVQPGT